MDNEQTPLIERLHNEADQCRSDGADDIANLLGDCICEIRRLREHAVILAETARQVERERCAVVCESGAPWAAQIEWWQKATKRDVSARTALECAAAIRRPEPSNGWPDTDAERSAGG